MFQGRYHIHVLNANWKTEIEKAKEYFQKAYTQQKRKVLYALSYFENPANDFRSNSRVIHFWVDCSFHKQTITKLGTKIAKGLHLKPVGIRGTLSVTYIQCWRRKKSEKFELIRYTTAHFC